MDPSELDPNLLLNAYAEGTFPMAHDDEGGRIYWYDPDPRTIIPLDKFHVSRSLRRTLKKKIFEVRYSTNFRAVMEGCAESAPGRETTWISPELIELYSALHRHGYAQSCETYLDGELVGGVYGVSLRGLFAGESMFSRATDASKVALVSLLRHLRESGYTLFDTQFTTAHLQTFGALEISRAEYKRRLAKALNVQPGAFKREEAP